MSAEIHVLLVGRSLPDIARWQAAIDGFGFDAQLDPETIVATHTGFLPVKLPGCASGFEFDVGPASEVLESYPDYETAFGTRDSSANFRWGSNLSEMTAAMIASATLAQLCDGVWFDPENGECHNADEALKLARASLNQH